MAVIRHYLHVVTSALFLILLAPLANALEPVKGEPLLEISGNISTSNTKDGKAVFDIEALTAFTVTEIYTKTPWTDGLMHFEGVLLKDLMKSLGAEGKTLKATAINDYTVSIPVEDILKHDVILAYKMNGKIMSIRDKGPLWIIYPWTDTPALQTELFHSRSIWQLNKISIE